MTYSQHRADLKNICQINLKQQTEEIGLSESINKKLQLYYSSGDETVLFRTFEEWVKMGYTVKKGSKAFKFWGTPEEFEIRNPKDPSKVEGIGSFCPVVFKFSENQVYNSQNSL